MSKLKVLKRDDFTLRKAKISDSGIEVDFLEKRTVGEKTETLEHNVKAKFIPHKDLIDFRDDLKEYLFLSYNFGKGFDFAEKFAKKGEQKQQVDEAKQEIYDSLEVTGVSIGGQDQLKGAVISGKIKSNNGSKCAMNTPRIVFSSDKIGYETEVQQKLELIELEVFKYLFEGKSSQESLFDDNGQEGVNGEPQSESKSA